MKKGGDKSFLTVFGIGGFVGCCLALEAFLAGTLTVAMIKGYVPLTFVPIMGLILVYTGYKIKKRNSR